MGLSAKGWILLCFIASVFFLVLGGILIPVFKVVIRDQLKKQLTLNNGTESFDNWITPPVPVYFNVYLFHYLNAKEIMKKSQGTTPNVKEMGPYVYREIQEKFDIEIKGDNITYKERKTYRFVPEKSAGFENDTLVSPNLPAFVVINFLRNASKTERFLANFFFLVDPLFKTLSVRDIIWGYKDPNMDRITKLLNVTAPKKYGIFYGKNNTNDGVYKISSGRKDISKLGQIKSWNGKSSVPYWNTPQCRQINGSDGTIFPPNQNKTSVLYIFSSDVCRSIHTVYEKQVKLRNIVLNRYIPPSNLFTTGDVNPENKGFCTPKCLPSGLLNVSLCQQNAPIVLSQPHFYQASPQVINSVKGINPQKEKHETKLDVEPMTGMPMDVAKRLQVNLYVEKVKYVTASDKVDKRPMPVLWIDENAQLTKDTAIKFHQEVQVPLEITFAVQYGLIAFGVFLFLLILLLIIKAVLVKSNYKKFVNEPTMESSAAPQPADIDYDVPVPVPEIS